MSRCKWEMRAWSMLLERRFQIDDERTLLLPTFEVMVDTLNKLLLTVSISSRSYSSWVHLRKRVARD